MPEEYAPPELIPTLDRRLEFSFDFWTLGISIYKMLTGNYPFLDTESIMNDDIPRLQELSISNEAKEFLKNLLNKNLFERLGSKQNPKNVKQDPFFNEINWEKLENGELEPPFKPVVVKT